MDEVTISKAIVESYLKDFVDATNVDVAIAGAGPAGMAAAYYLAKKGVKTVIFEKQLRFGGGMPGGGMMFNRIVVESQGKKILDEFDVRTTEYENDYYISDSLETVSTICSKTIKAGARIFNLITVEDVMIREDDKVTGLVLNWTSVGMSNLHVDPLTIRSKAVIDATGHDSEICRIVERKVGPKLRTETGEVIGEKSMWAEVGERDILENTREVYPRLIVSGMAANAVYGSPRMGAIFSGMLLSGKKQQGLLLILLKEMSRMRLQFKHCDYIRGDAKKKAKSPLVGDLNKKDGYVDDTLVVLFPDVHLFPESLPPSDFAFDCVKKIQDSLKKRGYEAYQVPFGWYKMHELRCKGHPLSQLSRTIRSA